MKIQDLYKIAEEKHIEIVNSNKKKKTKSEIIEELLKL
jgi:hypothetical protein